MLKKVLIISTVFLFSSMRMETTFDEVLSQASSEELKHKLIEFQADGIERETHLHTYHIDSLLHYAKSYLGTPHRLGGTTKHGIDCSGFVVQSHKKFGVILPHSSHEIARYGHIIVHKDSLRPGDLVFFYGSYNANRLITHSGIYTGENNFIHASAQSGVIYTNMETSKYWKSKYLFGTRLYEKNKIEIIEE